MLRFDHVHPVNHMTRGLTAESLETFNTAYIGEAEFGYYFRVSSGANETWRWAVRFPVSGETSGFASNEAETRETLQGLYQQLLVATHLEPRGTDVRNAA